MTVKLKIAAVFLETQLNTECFCIKVFSGMKEGECVHMRVNGKLLINQYTHLRKGHFMVIKDTHLHRH